MNKNYLLPSILVLAVISLLPSEKVLATVGGPTYISQIAYKALDNSVYYLESDMGGRGCPPLIHSVNVAKAQDMEVKTCDEVFQEFFKDSSEADQQQYEQFISDTYKDLPYIASVNLKKNNIDVRVEVLSEHIENDETFWTEFRATLTQDNKEVAKLEFRGCAKDQPHIFEGYRIPNTDAMAILISNKGDCFEGGYVKESLNIIRGIKYYDTNIVRSFKEESATEPNTGNMVVYAIAKDGVNNNTTDPQNTSPVAEKILITAIFIIGTTLGYIVGRKFSRSQGPSPKN